MNTLKLVGMILLMLISVVIVIIVLFQSAKTAGLSGAISGSSDTYFGQGKNKSTDEKLKKWTKIAGIVFLVGTLVLSIIINRAA